MLTNEDNLRYNIKRSAFQIVELSYGGIAQLARAFGSYPKCHWFKSNCRYQIWPGGQAVKTPPFHGGSTSSNLVRVTILFFKLRIPAHTDYGRIAQLVRALASHARGHGFESPCVHQAFDKWERRNSSPVIKYLYI